MPPDPHGSAFWGSPERPRSLERSRSGTRPELHSPPGAVRQACSGAHIRVRSYSAIPTLEQSSQPSTPAAAPCNDSPPGRSHDAHAPSGPHPPDSTVHLRRVGSKTCKQGGMRGYGGGGGPWARLLRGSLERRVLLVVMSGMMLGAVMHTLVYWHGITTGGAMPDFKPSPRLVGSGAAGGRSIAHDRRHRGQRRPEAPQQPPAPQLTNKGARVARPGMSSAEAAALGMPGDSDRLPNTAPWTADKWRGVQRVSPADAAWPNTLAICAIMRNEHPDDVEEWIRYHRWLGVDQIFIKENAESVPPATLARLQPLIDEGFLYLSPLPGPKHPLQNRWYNRCSKPDLAGSHSWVAFIDLDEFMVVLDKGVAARKPDLKGVLRGFRGNAGLSMQWVMFGSSGHVERPPGGPLAHYTRCTGHLSFQMKCMANMYHATHHMMVGNTVHDCTYRLDHATGVDEPPVTTADGTRVRMYGNTNMTNPNKDPTLGDSRTYRGHLDRDAYDPRVTPGHKLALFHYVTRSLDDYTSRKIKLPSGIYTHNYVRYGKQAHQDLQDAAVMAKFEHANHFDGEAPICESAAQHAYASQCCS